MDDFIIDKSDRKMSLISRTISMKEERFDRINEIDRQTGVSFHKIVNQCIEYVPAHYGGEDPDKKPGALQPLFAAGPILPGTSTAARHRNSRSR